MGEDNIECEHEIVGHDPKFADYVTKVKVIFYVDGGVALSEPESGCDGMFIYLYPEQVAELKKLLNTEAL